MAEMVFKEVGYQLSELIADIDRGEIGLPDIQRPFVWEAAKVRDLFDSMYRGYPVGHLLLWESGAEPGARQIGSNAKVSAPRLLIVDGQQRLTSLFAVMRQRKVVGRDYAERSIRIAFRPRDATFSVADAATDRDPSFLNDISDIWVRPPFTVITEFMSRLQQLDALEAGDEDRLPQALSRLDSLRAYPFTALVLGETIAEEQVAEVFVRINSKGKNLNQADFILTLMSVFWDEGRTELETWCRDARRVDTPAWNHYLKPDPDQMLRVAVALGFRRGRLEEAYSVLRGRDPRTGKTSPETRAMQFEVLAKAQARVLDSSVWKDFLQCLMRAGHRSSATISSNNAILYAYAFYLIGKHDYHVPLKQLRDLIARWFFMSSLTGRYSSSPETTVAADLGDLPTEMSPGAFVATLDRKIEQELTNDYWQITLPGSLATSGATTPTLFAYLASLCVLDAPVLFSQMRCAELMDPAVAGASVKVQRHHLHPRKHLERLGITDIKQVNQIANLALLEWHDNLAISATNPAEYWPAYLDGMRNPPPGMPVFSEPQIERMLHLHATPENWPAWDYDEFLVQRRRGMAAVIREAFERLSKGEVVIEPDSWPPSAALIEHLLMDGETNSVEFKSSLRADTANRGVPPKVLEKVVARTVAGFLNQGGGILVIGADDSGRPIGLAADLATLPRKDLDGFQQALVQVLSHHLGNDVAAAVRIHLAEVSDGVHLALLNCRAHPGPVFLREGQSREFHVRSGNTTRLLDVEEASRYIGRRWTGKPAS